MEKKIVGKCIEVPLEAKFDARLISWGVFPGLHGFMSRREWEECCGSMRVKGLLVGLPMTLPVRAEDAASVNIGDMLLLKAVGEGVFASIRVEDIYEIDWRQEARGSLGTEEAAHPWVQKLNQWGSWRVGGSIIEFFGDVGPDPFQRWLSPSQCQARAEAKGWRSWAAFQTRNPLHGAHIDLLQRVLGEDGVDGVIIHPAMGITKKGDLSPPQRARSYEAALIALGQPAHSDLVYAPLAMRMAGPKEAIWHAVIRRAYGATHFVVGRDHAGPGNGLDGKPYYGENEARRLAKELEAEIGLKILGFNESKYSVAKKRFVLADDLEPGEQTRSISGTEMRKMIDRRELLPDWYSPREIAEAILPPKLGVAVFMSGLSGAGKSTLATRLSARWEMAHGRPMAILDGDEARKMLSSELGFSREHRDLNIERLGFVCAEIAKQGGACVVAAIAPYHEARAKALARLRDSGVVCFVHVSTSLDVCEKRDPKGLYAKARSGLLKGFTGIDDPYEIPMDADLVLDTASLTVDEACLEIEDFIASKF